MLMCGNIAMLEDLKEGADLVRFKDHLFFVWNGERNIRIYSEGGQLMDGIEADKKLQKDEVLENINEYLENRAVQKS